ncbi:MAG: glycosyltransferase family 2 protein [Cyanobacteria bacterium]|nr:glycosyltransferase family 2 protein [Cyanobacteriota bacterium]
MPAISIFIICKNEERIIARCLEQASKLADEIILIDSGSTDLTLAIAKQYSENIYLNEWLGYGKQKNLALAKCSNEWVMSIDADEVLTDELIDEIKALGFEANGYQVARKLFIGDKFIRHGGYYPDYQLRLFKKSLGRFCDSEVHESVEMLEAGEYNKNRQSYPKLKNPLNHYSYQNLKEMEKAFEKFAKLSQKKKNLFIALISYLYSFVNKYFVRLGLLHGLTGLRLALIHARYSYLKYYS